MANRQITKEEMKAILQQREDIIREQWVKAAEVKIVREELVKCQQAEGVNSLYACKFLAEKYLSMMKGTEYRVTGWRKIDTE